MSPILIFLKALFIGKVVSLNLIKNLVITKCDVEHILLLLCQKRNVDKKKQYWECLGLKPDITNSKAQVSYI